MARKRSALKSFARGYNTSLKSGGAAAAKALIKGTDRAVKTAVRNSPARKAALAEASKLHRNAGSKVRRIERNGIVIRGSEFDPRAATPELRKMTTRQLRSYSKRLAQFNDRNTKFVAGANGTPLPLNKFNEYKSLERQQNQRARQRIDERGNIPTPDGGTTLKGRNAMVAPEHPRMEGGNVRTPFNESDRDPSQFPSVRALDKMINSQKRVLQRGHLPKEIRTAKDSLYKILDSFGDAELVKLARSLTNNQIDVLWFDLKYAKEILHPYNEAKLMAMHGKDAEIINALEDDISDIYEALTWAKNHVPRTARKP